MSFKTILKYVYIVSMLMLLCYYLKINRVVIIDMGNYIVNEPSLVLISLTLQILIVLSYGYLFAVINRGEKIHRSILLHCRCWVNRYIPGKVGYSISKIVMMQKYNIHHTSYSQISAIVVIEGLIVLLSALIFAFICSFFLQVAQGIQIILGVASFLLCSVLLASNRIIDPILRWLSKRVNKDIRIPKFSSYNLVLLPCYFVIHLLTGIYISFLSTSLLDAQTLVLENSFLMSASGAFSMIVIFAPAGIGAQELAYEILSKANTILPVLIIFRVFNIIIDFLISFCATFIMRLIDKE